MTYAVANVDELEPGGRTGRVKLVRRALALEPFGLNWFGARRGADEARGPF